MVNPRLNAASIQPGAPGSLAALLELAGFGLAFGETPVFDGIDLVVPGTGIAALTGPQGGGKSSLLRTLAGLHDGLAGFRSWGEIRVEGQPLAEVRRPVLVRQEAASLVGRVRDVLMRRTLARAGSSSLMEVLERHGVAGQLQGGLDAPMLAQTAEVRRQVGIVAAMLDRPALLLLDEPLAGLDEAEAGRLVAWLRRIRAAQPLLLATSDEALARRHADVVAWLDGPSTARLLAPGAAPAAAEATPAAAPAPLPRRSRAGAEAASMVGLAMLSDSRAPDGFHWIDPGRLATCPRPGTARPLHEDLESLQDVGITHLISVSEHELDADALEEAGLSCLHLPLREHQAPSIRQTYMLVHRMQQLLNQGHGVAVVCKTGLGCSATIFAAWLMREGGLAVQAALARLRAIDRHLVQTAAQEAFLQAFERDLQSRGGTAAALTPNG